ncbi:MAG: hypothetical protein AABZ06_11025 [Bdellovibrionota bacterium]
MDKFEKLHALVKVRLVRAAQGIKLLLNRGLFLAPRRRLFLVKHGVGEHAVDLIDVHLVQTVLQPTVLDLKPRDLRFLIGAFILVVFP